MPGARVARRGFKNAESLRRILKNLPDVQRQPVKAALVSGGSQIVSMQKRLAPVDEGETRDSIKGRTGDRDPLEFGSLRKRKAIRDQELTYIITAGNPVEGNTTRSDAHLQEFGTERMGKQPFFFPAFRANKKSVMSKIRRAARKAIRDAVRQRLASGG